MNCAGTLALRNSGEARRRNPGLQRQCIIQAYADVAVEMSDHG
jgi:hypothetical protein